MSVLLSEGFFCMSDSIRRRFPAEARNVSGSGVGDGAAGTLLCRLSYLSGLCIDVDIELNRRRDGVLLPVFLFFVMCDVLT